MVHYGLTLHKTISCSKLTSKYEFEFEFEVKSDKETWRRPNWHFEHHKCSASRAIEVSGQQESKLRYRRSAFGCKRAIITRNNDSNDSLQTTVRSKVRPACTQCPRVVQRLFTVRISLTQMATIAAETQSPLVQGHLPIGGVYNVVLS